MSGFVLTQIGPPNKVLKLEGPNAPYGRPRRGAVAETERELNIGTTRYDGNRVPTRVVFQDMQSPIVLTGRFMDSRIGAGGALAKWDELDAFVADAVPCRMEWAGVLTYTGLVTKCKRWIESEAEFQWWLTFEPDLDDSKPIQAPTPPPSNASDLAKQIQAKFANVGKSAAAIPPDIEYSPGFLDTIRNAISTLNQVSATFMSLANSIDDFESALASDVDHFRAGIAQYGKAIDQLQTTLDTGENDFSVATGQGPSQMSWYQQRSEMDSDTEEILAILAILDLQAEIAQKGEPDRDYRAVSGDTWESIALAQMGSADLARTLREANGVRYGTQPFVGQLIHIPKTS